LRVHLGGALNQGITPEKLTEAIVQSVSVNSGISLSSPAAGTSMSISGARLVP